MKTITLGFHGWNTNVSKKWYWYKDKDHFILRILWCFFIEARWNFE